jgi:hypothetical protein
MTLPTDTLPSWSATRQGKRELAAAAVFVVAFAAVPLFLTELYPFSRAPMFSDAPQCYGEYTVLDPDEKPLDPRDFDLQRNYWGNPLGVGVGFEPPPSLDRFGSVPATGDIAAWIAPRLARFPHLRYVDVFLTRIGAVDDWHIGEAGSVSERIANPHFQGTAK